METPVAGETLSAVGKAGHSRDTRDETIADRGMNIEQVNSRLDSSKRLKRDKLNNSWGLQ